MMSAMREISMSCGRLRDFVAEHRLCFRDPWRFWSVWGSQTSPKRLLRERAARASGVASMQSTQFEHTDLWPLSLRPQRAAGALVSPYTLDGSFGPALDHSTSNARTKKG